MWWGNVWFLLLFQLISSPEQSLSCQLSFNKCLAQLNHDLHSLLYCTRVLFTFTVGLIEYRRLKNHFRSGCGVFVCEYIYMYWVCCLHTILIYVKSMFLLSTLIFFKGLHFCMTKYMEPFVNNLWCLGTGVLYIRKLRFFFLIEFVKIQNVLIS